MPGSVLSILSAAGLAGSAGHRAFIPALAVGALHHVAAASAGAGETPFFALSGNFAWLGDPVVMVVLGVLTVVELLAEANPDVPELVNLAMKLPKAASGFILAAAAMGQMSESSMLLATSGLLGAGTALGVDHVRADVKHTVDEGMGEATDGMSTKAISVAESGWSLGLAGVSITMPVLVLAAGAIFGAVWFWRRSKNAAKLPCPACTKPVHPQATACPHCRAAIAR